MVVDRDDDNKDKKCGVWLTNGEPYNLVFGWKTCNKYSYRIPQPDEEGKLSKIVGSDI